MPLPYNYDKLSRYYEILEGGKVDDANLFLEKILERYKAKRILDFTCGTGAQTLWLAKRGHNVLGADISPAMLKIAKQKAREAHLLIKLREGDMRTSKFGTFDAVITIFNAIGHLNKSDFERTVRNISSNLKKDGIYIFDIFNLDFMEKNFKAYRFIDVATEVDNTKFVRFNNNRLDKKKGMMEINQETFVQEGSKEPKIFKERWTMQIYRPSELKRLLERNGFVVLDQCGMDGSDLGGASVLTIAKKL